MRCMSQNKKQLGSLDQNARVNAGDITKMSRTLPTQLTVFMGIKQGTFELAIDNTA